MVVPEHHRHPGHRLRGCRALLDPGPGGKFQAVPGYHNYTWLKIDKPGSTADSARTSAAASTPVRSPPSEPSAGAVQSLAGHQKRQIEEANAAAAEQRKLSKQTGPGQVENP